MHLSLDCGHNFATIFVNVHIRSKQGKIYAVREEKYQQKETSPEFSLDSAAWYQWYVNKSFQEDRESFDFHFHLFCWWSQSTRGVFSWNYVDILLIWWWFSQKGKNFYMKFSKYSNHHSYYLYPLNTEHMDYVCAESEKGMYACIHS